MASVVAWLREGLGVPEAAIVKLPGEPTVKDTAPALVNAGAIKVGGLAALIVSVKLWVASGLTPLVALKPRTYVPLVPAAGVPDNTPEAASKVSPAGNDSGFVRVMTGAGLPAA